MNIGTTTVKILGAGLTPLEAALAFASGYGHLGATCF